MSKSEDFLRRSKGGISEREVSSLIEEIRREEALEKAPKDNPFHFKDERAQHLSDLWFSQKKTASVEQKDKVGLVFISKFLGLGDKIAQKFAEGNPSARHAVGMRQSALPVSTRNVSDFWQEVQKIFPDIYTDGDIDFLVKKGGIDLVLLFLWQLEVPLAEKSPVLHSLAVNAHAYK